jgi:hypothetical protein
MFDPKNALDEPFYQELVGNIITFARSLEKVIVKYPNDGAIVGYIVDVSELLIDWLIEGDLSNTRIF